MLRHDAWTPAVIVAGVSVLILSVISLTFVAAGQTPPPVVDERTVIPTPPGGGPGTSILPFDQALPGAGNEGISLPQEAADRLLQQIMADRQAEAGDGPPGGPAGSRSLDDIGGDDVIAVVEDAIHEKAMDIASNGDIYMAVRLGYVHDITDITVYRSQDGGDTWIDWATVPVAIWAPQDTPSLHIAEGIVDRCFVAFKQRTADDDVEICVAHSDLALESGDFGTPLVVMGQAGSDFYAPELTSDACSFNSYYLYLVADADRGEGGDIWFARSVNQGNSFESPYKIGTISLTDRNYRDPSVAYGFGGYVHVSWHLSSETAAFDAVLRYRRAAAYANGGLGAWDPILTLTSTGDDIWDLEPWVGASITDNQVVIGYGRSRRYEDGHFVIDDPGVLGSEDGGETFPTSTILPDGLDYIENLEKQESTGDWILGGGYLSTAALQRSNGSDVMTWSECEILGDEQYFPASSRFFEMAIDPSRGDQAAVAWSITHSEGLDSLLFDAEWRGGPGYPNLEDGFPLELEGSPVSPPALVDLDGDDDLEIIFGDGEGDIQAFHHDGSTVTGWPVHVAAGLSDGPVAIGDLRGDGTLMVMAGALDGRAVAFYADGSPVPGWPFDTGQAASAYVSIGVLDEENPRLVAVGAGERLYFLDHSASQPHGFYWFWPGRTFAAPIAIGDVDGDGVGDAVGGVGTMVFAVHADQATAIFGRVMSANVSDAPTLGDFDFDDDVEIVAPLANGSLYLIQGDGTDYPGDWPFVSPTASALSSAAIANCLGGPQPEIAVAARNWNVHLLWENGDEQYGYPVTTDGWAIHGTPIMGFLVDPYSADVVIGARGNRAWAWDNFGSLVPGWPRHFADNIYQSPAMGDLDLDGRTEVVFTSSLELVIFDLNQVPAGPGDSWPMYGYDHQRTGCADCPNDPPVDVEDPASPAVTRVQFTLPTPNPTSGWTSLSYAVPERALVRLEVFDIQGRQVATVERHEVEAGERMAVWDGRDDHGHELPSGRYLARLQVRGPRVNETIVRAVTVVR